MKLNENSRTRRLWQFAIFSLVLISSQKIRAQDPWFDNIPTPSTRLIPMNQYGYGTTYEATPAFSPSATSFKSGGLQKVVCAYVYRPSGNTNKRVIGFSRSIDSGRSWSVVTTASLTTPTSYSTSLENMDDPQLLWIGGDTLVCVVRAWSENSLAHGKGNRVLEQPHSIYTRAGIYMYVSLDAGSTWGYWTSGGSYSTSGSSSYGLVAEQTESTITTVEYPRMAFRRGFSDYGYIVWHERTWSEPTTNQFRVSSSRVGIRGFNAPGVGNGGKLLTPDVGSIYNTFGVSSPLTGPERPSVAISPDNGIWLAFYVPIYDENSLTVDDVERGHRCVNADWYIVRGDMSFNIYSEADFNFSTAKKFTTARIAGIYDANRGYMYGPDTLFHDLTNANDSDVVDFATGPSIQVAVADPLSCDFRYHVGVLITRGNNEHTDANRDEYKDSTSLAFYTAPLTKNATAQSWWDARVSFGFDPSDQYRHPVDLSARVNGKYRLRIFPVLKYANVDDGYLSTMVFEPWMEPNGATLGKPKYGRSFFTLAYMDLIRGNSSGDHLSISGGTNAFWKWDSIQCITAVSFDNERFTLIKSTGTSTQQTVSYLRPSSKSTTLSNILFPTYWGKQIDIAGEGGPFRVYPVWHEIVNNNTTFGSDARTREGIKSSPGEISFIKPYLAHFPVNDPAGFPEYSDKVSNPTHTRRFFKVSGETLDGGWSPYAYFNYRVRRDYDQQIVYDDRPSSITALSSFTPHGVSGLANSTQAFNHPSGKINGSTSTFSGLTQLPTGLFYADYQRTEDPPLFGTFGYSNQRQSAMTGRMLHVVTEKSNRIMYGMSQGLTLSSEAEWIAPVILVESPQSGVTYTRPAISVYQLGDQYGFCGQAAIAVVWTEIRNYSSNTNYNEVSIKMRTREFDICKGGWPDWSPTYTIHTHYYRHASEYEIGSDDQTTAVIAPMVNPIGSGVGMLRTNLLGWVVSWTSPKVLSGSGTFINKMVAEQSDVGFTGCPKKFKSGLYSRSWVRYNTTISSPYAPYLSNEAWGTYPSASIVHDVNYGGMQPKTNVGVIPNNALKVTNGCESMDPMRFPTMTHTENKSNSQYEHEVAISTDGSKMGIWTMAAKYKRVPGPGYIGALDGSTTGLIPMIGTSGPAEYPRPKDRNPCVTVNSSGQRFIAWERMQPTFYMSDPPVYGQRSSIMVARSFINNSWPDYWTVNGVRAVQRVVWASAGNSSYDWLRNPSITAYPKSRWPNTTHLSADLDRGVVELGYWHKNVLQTGGGWLQQNALYSKLLAENSAIQGAPIWLPSRTAALMNRSFSQRSMGTFNAGPAGVLNSGSLSSVSPLGYTSFVSNVTTSSNQIDQVVQPAYKGTFDTLQEVDEYASEQYYSQGEGFDFRWGAVYICNTSTGARERQVMMHVGDNVNGWTGPTDIRDSIYRTEEFDWEAGKTLKFYRGFGATSNTSVETGGAFYNTALRLRMRIELVGSTGNTLHVENVEFSPGNAIFDIPKTISLINDSTYTRDVYLRVKVDTVTGLNQDDSVLTFATEVGHDPAPSFGTITYSLKGLGSPRALISSAFKVIGLSPNPVLSTGVGQTYLTAIAPEASNIVVSMYDMIGREISKDSYIGSGELQQFELSAPEIPGSYIIQITCGQEVVMRRLVVSSSR